MTRPTLFSILLFLFASVQLASANTVSVVTREVPPFAYLDEQQQWQGIAIELWEKIAADLALESQYRDVSLEQMLSLVTSGEADIAVGALSVTPEREKAFNFSHPFFSAGLGVAVPLDENASSAWRSILYSFISPAFLTVIAGLLALLATVGGLAWLVERKRNPQFPADFSKGIGAGLWWSSVTMTTVGYGDKAPVTFWGRVLGLIWMFASIILISTITASITTSLTVDALGTDITKENDLYSVKTATVAGSTSQLRLKNKGIAHRKYDSVSEALQAMLEGKVDAVVYDKPLLRYLARADFADKISVLPITFEEQNYAFGLPVDSPYREQINQRLLEFTRGPEWNQLVTRHLGEE